MTAEIAALAAMTLLLFAQITLLILLIAWNLSSFFEVPFVPTPRYAFPAIAEALDIRDGEVVYELGSGDGRFVLWCARRFPSARFIGVERNALLVLSSRCRALLAGSPRNLSFRRESFFSTDLSSADKIYAYLLHPVMDALLPKLEQELSQARFVSRAFVFTGRPIRSTINLQPLPGPHGRNRLYVYTF